MAISPTLLRLAREGTKTPNLILEIEGVTKLFSAIPVEKIWRFDEGFEFDTVGLRFDTAYPTDDAISCISPDKTSTNLTQQITPDKGGTSSVPALDIALLNFPEVFEQLKFENIDEILGKKASVYITYKGASHPEDSLPILLGYIDEYAIEHGLIILSVSHPENLKRKEIFQEYSNQLTDDIDDLVTTIPVISTVGFFTAQDTFKSYIKIGDEAMEVISKTGNSFDVIRGAFGTIPEEHDEEADVSFIYELSGQAIPLALKLLMSSEDPLTWGETVPSSFGLISVTEQDSRVIFYDGFDVKTLTGVVAGDFVTVTGSEFNDGTYTIVGFGSNEVGTWLVTDGNFTTESTEDAVTVFTSKYNVLPFGLGLTGREVDVDGHEEIERFNPQNFPDYKFFLDSQVNGKEFIDKEIYFPVALFSIPRRAKISCKIVQPPLAQGDLIRLDQNNLTSIDGVSVSRSTHKFYYNTIFYKFNYDPIDTEFTSGAVFRNELSLARIKTGTSQLSVESLGLRESTATRNLIDRQQRRSFDRYQFAPQVIRNVKPFAEVGFSIEVGDVIVFGSEETQLTDLNENTRFFEPRLCEVINKSFNVFTQETTLELLESAYGLDSRFGIISLSSFVDSLVSPTELKIKKSFDVGEFERESDKWRSFIRENIWIRSPDYSESEVVQLLGISESDSSVLITSPISVSVGNDWIIEIPEYQNSGDLYKDIFVYFNPSVLIQDVISPTVLEVPDGSLFFEGSRVYIRSENFLFDSFDENLEIDSISGNEITLNKTPSFAVQVGFIIDLIGFSDDDGKPYRIV